MGNKEINDNFVEELAKKLIKIEASFKEDIQWGLNGKDSIIENSDN